MSFKLGALTAALVLTGIVADAGFIHVRVHEAREDGTHVNLYVPAILATSGARFMPEKQLEQHADELRAALPALRVAARELERLPDGPLVEVTSAREEVRVAKEGSRLVVEAKNEKEEVHVSLPLRAMAEVAQNLESALPRK
jgi:hypothetical protein